MFKFFQKNDRLSFSLNLIQLTKKNHRKSYEFLVIKHIKFSKFLQTEFMIKTNQRTKILTKKN